MRDVLLERAERQLGAVRARPEEVAAAFQAGKDSMKTEIVALDATLSEWVEFMSRLTWPATRFGLVARGEWTLVHGNRRGGPDFADEQRRLGFHLPVESIRVVDTTRTHRETNGYRVPINYTARMLSIQNGRDPVRSITCADDGGRWVFETAGTPLPVEADFDYGARLKRARFTSDNLQAVLSTYQIDSQHRRLTESDRFVLVTEIPQDKEWRAKIESLACSIAEDEDPAHGYFLRAQSWIRYMSTHAESAVFDLTKAQLLNPEYERLCRKPLRQARRTLGRAEFERATDQAAESLARWRTG
ncbi:MAG: hypothetical protein AAGA90_01130 [Actinomycetota bacterium]